MFQLLLRDVAKGTVVVESTGNPLIRPIDPFSLTAWEKGQEELKSWSLSYAKHPSLANDRPLLLRASPQLLQHLEHDRIMLPQLIAVERIEVVR